MDESRLGDYWQSSSFLSHLFLLQTASFPMWKEKLGDRNVGYIYDLQWTFRFLFRSWHASYHNTDHAGLYQLGHYVLHKYWIRQYTSRHPDLNGQRTMTGSYVRLIFFIGKGFQAHSNMKLLGEVIEMNLTFFKVLPRLVMILPS